MMQRLEPMTVFLIPMTIASLKNNLFTVFFVLLSLRRIFTTGRITWCSATPLLPLELIFHTTGTEPGVLVGSCG